MAPKTLPTEKLDLRITAADKRILKEAASVVRRSLTDFIRESALARAAETLADRRTFHLSSEKWKAFQATLDSPPRLLPGMERLLREPARFDPASDRS